MQAGAGRIGFIGIGALRGWQVDEVYDVTPFSWNLTPNLIARAAATLTVAEKGENGDS
jgi:hypothetical protein